MSVQHHASLRYFNSFCTTMDFHGREEDQCVLGFGLRMGFVSNENTLNIPRYDENICVINKPGLADFSIYFEFCKS